jgi:hypothetical protein
MAGNPVMRCYDCGRPQAEGRQFCGCGGNYFVESREEDAQPAADGAAPAGPPGAQAPDTPAPDTPAPDAPAPVSFAGRPRQLTVTLVMNSQIIRQDVAAGGRVALGRDERMSPFAAVLKADDLVGRRHAVIEYGADGKALIRDEYSLNGTVVNGEELRPGEERTLAETDQIRLGETAIVRIRAVPVPPPGDRAAGDGEGSQS